MSDYTPSTDDVRDQYASVPFNGIPAHARAEFDRWLAARDAARDESVRAEERERIARNIDAQGDAWHRDAKIERSCYRHAARIAREGA